MIPVAPPATAAPPSPATSPALTPLNRPKTKEDWTNKRDARHQLSAVSARLQIKSSGKGKQESWTVATSTKLTTRGSKQTKFRVRVSDVGFRVCLVYYDAEGKRREPYLCYLCAKEWQQAKRGTLSSFAQVVIDKLAERAAKEGSDREKLDEFSSKVNAFV